MLWQSCRTVGTVNRDLIKNISLLNFSWVCDYSNKHFWGNFWLWTCPVSGKEWLARDYWVNRWRSRTRWISLDTEVMELFTATQFPFNVYLAGITRPSALFDLWYLESSNIHVIVFVWCQFSSFQTLKEELSNLTLLQRFEITIHSKPT